MAPDGKERSRSYPDRAKREAEAFLVSVAADKLRGAYVDPVAGRLTFRLYAERGWREFDPMEVTLPWEDPKDDHRVTLRLVSRLLAVAP